MKLIGDVSGEEDLVIFGTIDGEIHVDGAVVVEESGVVHGNVRGRTVTVRGVVVGDAKAETAIRVDEGGKMVGDVRAPRVNIVKGARFRGHVHMTAPDGTVAATPTRRRRRRTEETEHAESSPRAREEAQRTKRAIRSTVPGSLRAVQKADTVVGDPAPAPRRPPAPRMPVLRRSRGRRKDPSA
jgi:cytoskeletal protein CcmA (bactofilin family)